MFAELNPLKHRCLMPGQNFASSSIPRDTPAKTPGLPPSLTVSSLLGSDKVLVHKWGKAAFLLRALVLVSSSIVLKVLFRWW